MTTLRIAIQKSGRLSEKSLELLRQCGITLSNGDRKLLARASNFPVEALYLRDDDIPHYVEQGVADVGILGENEVWERNRNVEVVERLGFAQCTLSLALPRDEPYEGLHQLQGKRIATSYPRILRQFLDARGVKVEVEEIGGSVEIATGIGLADGIMDIVSTGSTLLMNGLREVELVARSEAVLISRPSLPGEKQDILDRLRFRMAAVRNAAGHKYILLNAPNEKLNEICALLPGMKSPTLLPLAQPGWSSLHSVVKEDQFWDVIDRLRDLGAEGILVVPIEKMVV